MLEQQKTDRSNYDKQLMGVLGIQLWDDLFMRGCKPT
jgi:hypothetical protein